MIILITGASHTGKTFLAQKLLDNLKYPYILIDHIKMGLIRSGNTQLTPEDDEDLTGYLWPIIREMIKTAIENNQNMIVEGCYVPFDWRSDFTQKYLSEIQFICLAFTEEYIIKNIDSITDKASIIESRLDDSYCTKDLLIRENESYIQGFNEKEEICLISSDYDTEIQDIIKRFSF